MRRGVLLAATTVALLVAPTAGAGIAVRLSVNPSVVDVDTPARIVLRAYSVDHGVKRLDDRSGRRLHVEAVAPEGWVERVVLRHVSSGVWRGTYVFGGAGKWQLRVANWPGRGTAPRLYVTVREPTGS
jgi:hypothetical protein